MDKTLLAIPLLATLAWAPLWAHHGWSGYDETKTLTLTGIVRASSYENPHTYVDLQVDEGKPSAKLWHAVLAPPSRMQSKGIRKEDLKVGATVTVRGFQDKAKPNEAKIEEIVVNGKKIYIRR